MQVVDATNPRAPEHSTRVLARDTLLLAVSSGASLKIDLQMGTVRCRKADGVEYDVVPPPASVLTDVVAAIKDWAGCADAQSREGQFLLRIPVDLLMHVSLTDEVLNVAVGEVGDVRASVRSFLERYFNEDVEVTIDERHHAEDSASTSSKAPFWKRLLRRFRLSAEC